MPIISGSGGSSSASNKLDSAIRATDFTVSAVSAAAAVAWLTGAAVVYDGSTQIKIEAFLPFMNATGAAELILELYDGSTDLGRIGQYDYTGSGIAATLLTPTAASHTYSIRAWRTGSDRVIVAGNNTNPAVNGYMLITRA